MDNSVLTTSQVMRVLWRRRLVILASGLGVALAGFLIAHDLPHTYVAEGLLVVEPLQTAMSDVGPEFGASSTDIVRAQTEAEILRSHAMAEAVVDSLGLATNRQFMDSSVAGVLMPLVALRTAADRLVHALVPAENDASGEPAADDLKAVAVARLEDNLTIRTTDKATVIEVAFSSTDPGLAAAIVNRLMELHVSRDVHAKSDIIRHLNEALSDQEQRLWQKVVEADQKVQAFRTEHGLLEMQGAELSTVKLSELQSQLAVARSRMNDLKASAADATRAAQTGSIDASPEVLASPLIQRLREQESVVASALSNMAQRQGPRHPEMRARMEELANIRGRIGAEVGKIVEALHSDLSVARMRVADLETRIADAQARASAAAGQNVALQQLVKEADAKRAVYQSYMTRTEQTAHVAGGPQPDLRIAAAASPPALPSGPKTKAITAFAALIGFGLAIAITLFRDAMNGRVLTEDELSSVTRYPGLGLVPSFRLGRRHLCDAVVDDPQSEAAESIRGVWTGLRVARYGANRAQMVVVTSSLPNEGKTSLVTALGRIAALDGARVLVIDADFRMPKVGAFLEEAASAVPSPGDDGAYVDDLLARGEPPINALRTDPSSGLLYLPAGGRTPNPQSLLTGPGMTLLLEEARLNFDLILVDSPPVMRVSDAVMLARAADAVLFVAAWGTTSRVQLGEAVRRLQVPPDVFVGSLLCRVSRRFSGSYTGYRSRRAGRLQPRAQM